MANKQLTAKVRLNVTEAERNIDRLVKKINNLNNATNKVGTTNNSIEQKLRKSERQVTTIKEKVRQWATNQRMVTSATKSTNSMLGSISSRLRSIAATYLGIMGGKALIKTSDTITSAQNKLNYVNGQQMGLSSGDPRVIEATTLSMDKMYTSAQKVRMSYADMMGNVAKSMTLAGDSFRYSTDNAIRFQEIMSEAYTIGGASAQEMSSSMYQMIQALGAGVLAGDELRSVREGAPLAYKAIEEFAQKVYDTEESLKELASQGKITSDMVVAAIMDAGDKIDEAFENTNMTFAQAWEKIKNSAIKAFEPVSNKLNEMLNKAAENGAFEKIEKAFEGIAKVLLITFELISRGIGWIADNWSWLKKIIVGALILIGSYLIVTTAISIASAIKQAIAWTILHWKLLLVVLAIGLLIYAFYLWKTGAIDTTTAIGIALLALAVIMFLIFGWQVALIVALLALVVMFFEQVCYGAAWLAAWIVNICSAIWNVIVYVLQAIAAGIFWLIGVALNVIILCINTIIGIINFLLGTILWALVMVYNIFVAVINACLQAVWAFVEPFLGIIEFILNACNGGFNTFGDAVANLIGQIISWFLSLGKVVTKIIDAIFGTNWTAGLSALQDSVISWGKNEQGITLDREAPELPRIDAGNMFNTGFNAIGYLDFTDPNYAAKYAWDGVGNIHTGYVDPNKWGETAGNWGAGIKDKVNGWGSKFQSSTGKGGNIFDEIGNKLGLEFGDGFRNASLNPDDWDDVANNIGNIDGNTGSIADSMDLTEEDLAYLRKIAEMEWKKEYTTANITVDMSNYNTINGDSDLDGIVTKLTDKLYDEMNVLANGVYA